MDSKGSSGGGHSSTAGVRGFHGRAFSLFSVAESPGDSAGATPGATGSLLRAVVPQVLSTRFLIYAG